MSNQSISDYIDCLKQSNKLTDLLLNNTDDALYFYSIDGKLIYVNKVFEKITGYSVEELYEKNFIQFVHPDDIDRTTELWEGLFKGQLFDSVEYKIITKDGVLRWCISSWKIIRNEKNEEIGIFGRQQDISDRKSSEATLNHQKELAESASTAKSIFLSNMIHEVRTPLSAIVGFAELLNCMPDISDEKREKFTHNIQSSAKHLATLVDNILDLAKIEAGQMKLDNSIADLAWHIYAVSEVLRSKAETKNLTFELTFDSLIPSMIHSDATRLRQVLYNLIGNAIKFTDSGGIRLNISTDMDKSIVIFRIEDTGCGIEKDKFNIIFDEFAQMNSSVVSKFGGTGLGLSLSKKIVSQMGGRLRLLSSEVSKGSRFEFTIPIGDIKNIDYITFKNQGEKDNLSDLNKYKSTFNDFDILIVEDGLKNQEYFKEIISFLGANYKLVDNGQDAINACLKKTFDIILMDLQLPIIDGYSATKKIRANGVNTPIIAISANALSSDKEQALSVGCDSFYSKPLSSFTLIKILNNLRAEV